MSKQSQSRERIARNFIRTYGKKGFERFLILLARNESGQAIADEFNVSRERVRQWKITFGKVIVSYKLFPEIANLVDRRK